ILSWCIRVEHRFGTGAQLWLVKTKRRPVFSLKTLLSMNGRELREGGLRSQDRLGKEWKSSTRRARNGFPVWSKISNALKRLVSGLIISSHSCFLKPQEPVQSGFDDQVWGGSGMIWARMLAYIT